jgi:RNA polymerase sigma-70 factor, ECF subfamily
VTGIRRLHTEPPNAGSPLRAAPQPDSALRSAPETFDELYDEHFAFVWRSLRLLGVAPEALDDASQDVFCAAFRKWPEFRGDSSLRTWIFGIAQGIASNHRRGARRKQARLRELAHAPAAKPPSPEDLAQTTQQVDLVLSFSHSLDDGGRALFVLGLLERLPAPEIALSLGIPVNTVYSRLRKLRTSLQRWLKHEVGDE